MNFAEDGGGLPLFGVARDADTFPRLNRDAVVGSAILRDDQGAIWLALNEVRRTSADITTPGLIQEQLHLVRLDAPAEEVNFACDGVVFGEQVAYLLHQNVEGWRVRIVQPGRGDIGFELSIPTIGELTPALHDRVFHVQTYSEEGQAHPEIIARPEESFTRELPARPQPPRDGLLKGTSARYFDATGDWLLRQDPDGHLWSFSTRSSAVVDLGVHDWMAGTDDRDAVAFTCGEHGLLRVPIDGSAPQILDSQRCLVVFMRSLGAIATYVNKARELAYYSDEKYYTISKTGGARTQLPLPPKAYVLEIGPQKQIVYSQDPTYYSDGWGNTILDAWIGDWRFMDRGRDEHISRDGRRLHWLENAARTDGTGELMGAITTLGATSTRLLAYNVRRYDELDNGQLIAVSNAPGNSLYSRLILIDEAAQRSDRLAERCESYQLIPERHEILAKVRTSTYRVDVHRVPLPENAGLQVGK